MNYKLLFVALMFGMVGCHNFKGDKGDAGSSGSQGDRGVAGEVGPPGIVPEDPPLTDVQKLVTLENDYRSIVGQAPLTNGLTCTLYTVPAGSGGIVGTSLTTVTSFGYVGTINQVDSSVTSGLNVLPQALRALYTSWYVVRCTGKLAVVTSGYYSFELTSDDGSLLYIDGALLINNDGNHGATTKSAMKLLKGNSMHDIRLDYMQGPAGNQALILNSGGSLLPSDIMFP